ncbi:MAG TPA: chemotaxis protein CheX [Geobacteraceae bacterium]|nr:chemotaxis protein CheX [Geobacteraceae bacterium]
MSVITFEEIMFTIMSATQDTFMTYMGMEILAGKIEKKIEPVESDVVGIVGVAGERVGYIMYATDKNAAYQVAKELLMMEDADEEAIRDAIGELTNNIAGVFKSKYHEQYGSVALGLPLVVSGKIRPVSEPPEPEQNTTMNIQCKGVTIPFKSLDGGISFRIMVYM